MSDNYDYTYEEVLLLRRWESTRPLDSHTMRIDSQEVPKSPENGNQISGNLGHTVLPNRNWPEVRSVPHRPGLIEEQNDGLFDRVISWMRGW